MDRPVGHLVRKCLVGPMWLPVAEPLARAQCRPVSSMPLPHVERKDSARRWQQVVHGSVAPGLGDGRTERRSPRKAL